MIPPDPNFLMILPVFTFQFCLSVLLNLNSLRESFQCNFMSNFYCLEWWDLLKLFLDWRVGPWNASTKKVGQYVIKIRIMNLNYKISLALEHTRINKTIYFVLASLCQANKWYGQFVGGNKLIKSEIINNLLWSYYYS